MQKIIILISTLVALNACQSNMSKENAASPDINKESISAQYCYDYKYGDYTLPSNVTLAYQWCLQSAKQGNAHSQVLLAEMFFMGELGEKNLEYAFDWYSRAAKSNHAHALFMLAQFYEQGLVVEKDKKAAEQYLKKASVYGYRGL